MQPLSDPLRPPGRPTLAMAAACGAGVLWGTGALVVNLLVSRHGFTPASISFWRFAIGAAVLLLVFGRRLPGRDIAALWRPLVGAGVAMAGYVLCWFLGIERMGAAVPTLIALCLPPVLVSLHGVLRGRERLDAARVLVLGAALLGTGLVVSRHGPSQAVPAADVLAGVGYSLVSALLFAGFSLTSGRLSTRLGAGPAATCMTLVAAVTMGLYGWVRPLQWPDGLPPQAWYLYLGVVTAALALLAFSWGAARISATALTVATLIEPLTAVLLSAWLLGEALGPLQYVGAVLLMASIWGLGRRMPGA
ncbi:DMT family transporter [Pelomonas sp. APW6]|uniref:DMT family transporter n=1 Tax=Roseateles subflavus TaxID=3053353 RepID=A0ABT7LCQ7_9BURK|nr:DMT family transporter [Pelomonas sp. APW6]MDL5030648.1 DMT family transporter [Pelomonas sp. APW6]